MEKRYRFSITSQESGFRIDKFLTEKDLSLSRSYIKRLILSGSITVNQKKIKPHYLLKEEDEIEVKIPPPRRLEVEAEDRELDVVYEDKSLLVINKPPGMVIHPAAGNRLGTLVNALLHHCRDLSGIGGIERPGIVHRLDKDTSGLLLVAKDDLTHEGLSQQLKQKKMIKQYLALIKGELRNDKGLIETSMGRDPHNRKKMAVVKKGGKDAVTEYRVVERFKDFTLLDIRIRTGRTHQIRVHMAHIKHPVVGDNIYGRKLILGKGREDLKKALEGLKRQALHAYRIGFVHPNKGEYVEFEIPLAPDIQSVVEVLRKEKED